MEEKRTLCILHFNDVYELEDRKIEPAGGASRFSWLLDYIRQQTLNYGGSSLESATTSPISSSSVVKNTNNSSYTCLTLFSGDALSPSLLSTVTRGRHMIEVLNNLKVDIACIGNHDEDFGPSTFLTVAKETIFPWLLSNVKIKENNQSFDGTKEYHIYESTDKLWRIGFIGIWEYDCLATLATIDIDVLQFEPPIDAGKRLVRLLKEQYNCNCIIALTHMRKNNDDLFAANVEGIDILLGGHDHECMVEMHNHCTPSIKSGSDFRNVSHILMSNTTTSNEDVQAYWNYFQDQCKRDNLSWLVTRDLGTIISPSHSYWVSARQYDITSLVPYQKDMQIIVKKYMELLGKQMEGIIGLTRVPLDARFSIIRTQESNIGNFITDVIRQITEADVVILNSGTLRADSIIGPGVLLMKHLVSLLPLQDPIVTIKLSGALLLKILENSVSQYPKLEGRFAQVSGIRFSFDPKCAPGSRIVPGSVVILRSVLPSSTPSSHSSTAVSSTDESSSNTNGSTAQPSLPSITTSQHSSFPIIQRSDSFTTLDEVLTDSEEMDPDGYSNTDKQHTNTTHHHIQSTTLHKVATEPVTLVDLQEKSSHDYDLDPSLLDPVARTTTSSIANSSGTKVAMLRVRSTGDINAENVPVSSLQTSMHRTSSVPLPANVINHSSVPVITWEPLELTKIYKLSTKAYLLDGRDGYDMFLDPSIEIVVDSEGGPILPVIIRNHFRVLAGLAGLGKAAKEVKPFVTGDNPGMNGSSSSHPGNKGGSYSNNSSSNDGEASPISVASSDTIHESTLSLTKRLLPAMNTIRKVLTSPGTFTTTGTTNSKEQELSDDIGFSPTKYSHDSSVQSLSKAFDPIVVSPVRVHDTPTMTPVEEVDEQFNNNGTSISIDLRILPTTTTTTQDTTALSSTHYLESEEATTVPASSSSFGAMVHDKSLPTELIGLRAMPFDQCSDNSTTGHTNTFTSSEVPTTLGESSSSLKFTQSASDLTHNPQHHHHHHHHHQHYTDDTVVEHSNGSVRTNKDNLHHPPFTPQHVSSQPHSKNNDDHHYHRRAWTDAREKWRRVIEGRSSIIKNTMNTPSKASSLVSSQFAIAIAPIVDGRIHIVE